MYGIEKALKNLSIALDDLENSVMSTEAESFFDERLIKQISFLTNREISIRDNIFAEYAKHEAELAGEGYRSAAQAISSITHDSFSNSKKALDRINFLENMPIVKTSFEYGEINVEHVNHLATLYHDKFYTEDFVSDAELLLENAKVLTSNRFATALKHWKYMIQDLREINDGALVRFDRRKLSIWKDSVGDWIIEGVLDPTTGELLLKALESIRNKIWRDSSPQQREEYEVQQANVDALSYLAQGFITANTEAINPIPEDEIAEDFEPLSYSYIAPLTADITIDLDLLTSNQTTKEFLEESLIRSTPLARAHQKTFIKQVLCDATTSFPMISADGNMNLGRKVRLAPTRMKKQLALTNNQCEVDGCGVPARWCDAHHVRHWLDGGETKIENMALLCKRHHTLVHRDKKFEEKLSKQVAINRNILYDPLVNTG